MNDNYGAELERLVGIMARLRAKDGCPWDREQDLRSLRPYLIEETYEVLDEMDRVGYGNGKWSALCEELGDLLFQIVFHSQLAREIGEFTMADVAKSISDKIERRHPHVFGSDAGTDVATTAPQVLQNWAKLKAEEKKKKHGSEGSVLDGVPSAAPALMRAERLTEKASRIGFDWPDLESVRAKVEEELHELDEAIERKNRDELEHELGDLLFALCNLARFIQTPPEDALRQANRRFTERFHHVEKRLRENNFGFGEASLEQMDAYWNEAKHAEKEKNAQRPFRRPRASIPTVDLSVANWADVTAFWDEVSPALGWTRSDEQTSARYGDDAFALRVHKGGEKIAGLSFNVALPVKDSFEAAKAVLSNSRRVRELVAKDDLISFLDPAGIRWRLSVG